MNIQGPLPSPCLAWNTNLVEASMGYRSVLSKRSVKFTRHYRIVEACAAVNHYPTPNKGVLYRKCRKVYKTVYFSTTNFYSLVQV